MCSILKKLSIWLIYALTCQETRVFVLEAPAQTVRTLVASEMNELVFEAHRPSELLACYMLIERAFDCGAKLLIERIDGRLTVISC